MSLTGVLDERSSAGFDYGQQMIRVKALAVVVRARDGALLACQGSDGSPGGYARPIGGSVALGEYAEAAVRREVAEELGTDLVPQGLLAVVENLFVLRGERVHEIDFLFRGSLQDQALYEQEHVNVLDIPGVQAVWWSPRTPLTARA